MATQINTNQIKDGAVTPVKNSYTPVQLIAEGATYAMMVDNDDTETTIMSESIPGDTLGSTGKIYGEITGWTRNGDGTDHYVVVRLKYGATTVATTGSIRTKNSTSEAEVTIKFELRANGVASAQKGSVLMHYTPTGPDGNGGADDGVASEDSTGDLNLVVTWDFDYAGATTEYYQYEYRIYFVDEG